MLLAPSRADNSFICPVIEPMMGLGGVLFWFRPDGPFPCIILCWSVSFACWANLLHMCVWSGLCIPTSHEEGEAASDKCGELPPSPPGSGAGPLAGSLKKAAVGRPPLPLSRKDSMERHPDGLLFGV